jgi:uncharacterized membrane protein YbhN (UPF0104 family)
MTAGLSVWQSLSREHSRFLLLLLAALFVRAGVLSRYRGSLAADSDDYRSIAERIVAGEGFVDKQSHTATAYRPPLYPLLVAAILSFGGGDLAIGAVQAALGAATVALTVLCARRLGLGRASLAAGLLAAVDPLLAYETSLVMTETLATFLAALLLWLWLGEPGARRDLALGVAFGLCSLCRPTFWAVGVLAVAIWGFGVLRAARSATRSAALVAGRAQAAPWRASLGVAAGVVLVIAPWGIRNAIVMGRPIVTTTHGGYTLLLAHNPEYTRAVVDRPWGAVWEGDPVASWGASLEAAMAGERPPIDLAHRSPAVELDRDEWMNRRAREYIRREPVTALRSGLTLLGRFWNVVPTPIAGRPLSTPLRLAIGAFYAAVMVLAIVGTIRVMRFDAAGWWPLVALVAGFTAVHAVYWADMRMRSPLIPAIDLLAVAGLASITNSRNRIAALWPILKWVMFVAVVVFVARHGYGLFSQVEGQAFRVNWGWLALAATVSVAAWLPSAWYWRKLLSTLGPAPPWPQLLRAYYCGHLGKYLPGKAAVIVIRAALLRETGVSASSAAVTVTVESATYMWIGALLAILLYPSIAPHWPEPIVSRAAEPLLRAAMLVVVLAGGIAGLAVVARSYERVANLLERAERAAEQERGFLRTSIVGAAVFLGAWWIQGLTLGLTIEAVAPERASLGEWPFWTASAAVGLVGGFIAVFTPGGLGVREGLLMELLVVPLGPRDAVVVAVLLRGVALAGEIVTAVALYYGVKGVEESKR